MESLAIRLVVHGKVQGVFFRKHTADKAIELGLVGWVKNNPDGTVELLAQGPENLLTKMVEWCWEGSPKSAVTKIDSQYVSLENYSDFRVIR